MTGVQWTGLILFILSGSVAIVYGVVAWGTRDERRLEDRTPRCVVRAVDWIDSYQWDQP